MLEKLHALDSFLIYRYTFIKYVSFGLGWNLPIIMGVVAPFQTFFSHRMAPAWAWHLCRINTFLIFYKKREIGNLEFSINHQGVRAYNFAQIVILSSPLTFLNEVKVNSPHIHWEKYWTSIFSRITILKTKVSYLAQILC